MSEDFKPMLAADVKGELQKVKMPVLVSAKIDGIRAIVRGGKLLSRSLKPIPNKAIREALERPEYEGFDGELIVGDGINFQATTSVVMSPNKPIGDGEVSFWVFDTTDHPGPFVDRQAELQARFSNLGPSEENIVDVDLVPQTLAHDEAKILELEAVFLSYGFEGAMLRAPQGLYKWGRSTVKEGGLLKLKRFEDAEAVVVGFEEEMANNNEATTNELGRTKRSSSKEGKVGKGALGALIVEADGIRFNVGSGFTATQRATLWAGRSELPGMIVKYKHLPHGRKDAPRHPVFLGFRSPEDMSV